LVKWMIVSMGHRGLDIIGGNLIFPMRRIFAFILIICLSFFLATNVVRGDELGDLQKEIDNLQKQLEASKNATTPLESEVKKLESELSSIKGRLDKISSDLTESEKELQQQKAILASTVRNFYIRSFVDIPLLIIFAAKDASETLKLIAFQQTSSKTDKNIIRGISERVAKLADDKKRLASLRDQTSKQSQFLKGEIASAKSFQSEVQGKISALSARQQELLAAKFASAPVPLLAYTSLGGCSSDIGKSSGFSPRYGFFSLGVPNKTGLNQYGAKGRAEAGQSYEQILQAYYNNIQIADYGTGFNITVNGNNEYGQSFNNESMNIEEYLKHLYEMPTSWDSKALQAQAIAARSYALARTNNGQNSIPPNQSGQVVKKELNSQAWIAAVEATSGKVMVQNGSPISAWYSSTHGGVVLKSGQIGWNDTPWTKQAIDTSSGSAGSISELKSNAFDRQSPWFYCDWGYRSQYNSTAWLKEEEVVDIVNSYILWNLDNSTITHLSQTDQPTGDTWSADKVRQEIQNRGSSPISSVGSISTAWDGSGISKTITVGGRGFDAQKFKNMFNIRAPANIQIKPACQPDSALNCSKMYALYDVVRE